MSARHPLTAKLPLPATGQNAVARPAQQPRQLRRLNIGLLIPTLQSGGAERVCSLLANHWARKGHHVTLMTYADASEDSFPVSPFVERVVLGNAHLTSGPWATLTKNMARVYALRQQVKASELDVTLSFMSVSNSSLALAARGLSAVCIGAERTYPPAVPLPRVAEWARWVLYGWLDAVAAQTTEAAAWLQANTRAKSVVVIPNPIELPLTCSLPRLDPAALRNAGSRMLLAVGRLSTEKNFERLIRAFLQALDTPGAAANQLNWQLIIVGEGPERSALLRLIEQLGANGKVLLPGRAGNMADWYDAADAFALTSDFEGYPNGLLEALAHGVPSVACDCLTGPRELITDGVNGLLVATNSTTELISALRCLMGDSNLRKQLGSHADITLNAHAIESISARWENVFAQAMAARGQA